MSKATIPDVQSHHSTHPKSPDVQRNTPRHLSAQGKTCFWLLRHPAHGSWYLALPPQMHTLRGSSSSRWSQLTGSDGVLDGRLGPVPASPPCTFFRGVQPVLYSSTSWMTQPCHTYRDRASEAPQHWDTTSWQGTLCGCVHTHMCLCLPPLPRAWETGHCVLCLLCLPLTSALFLHSAQHSCMRTNNVPILQLSLINLVPPPSLEGRLHEDSGTSKLPKQVQCQAQGR